MSIRINDLTVTFQNRMKKNKVTAIDHASLEIPGGIYGLPSTMQALRSQAGSTDFWEKTAQGRLL